ncbi:MAG: hypothetical protein PUB21_06890 [Bacteroidales bacterium]|nr:hypothetical protein [Bacteroidales bacterium]
MFFFDLFFYTLYRFLRMLRRSDEDAKFGAFNLSAIYISFLIPTLFVVAGLIKDNSFSRSMLEENVFLLTCAIIFSPTFFLFWRRYFRLVHVEEIKSRYLGLSVVKRRMLQVLVYIYMIAVPVSFYVFFRLYDFGYV